MADFFAVNMHRVYFCLFQNVFTIYCSCTGSFLPKRFDHSIVWLLFFDHYTVHRPLSLVSYQITIPLTGMHCGFFSVFLKRFDHLLLSGMPCITIELLNGAVHMVHGCPATNPQYHCGLSFDCHIYFFVAMLIASFLATTVFLSEYWLIFVMHCFDCHVNCVTKINSIILMFNSYGCPFKHYHLNLQCIATGLP